MSCDSSTVDSLNKLKFDELRHWLKKYNGEVAEKYENQLLNKKFYQMLLDGLDDSGTNAEKELKEVLMFTAPIYSDYGQQSDDHLDGLESFSSGGELNTVLKRKSMRLRHKAGIHPVTLLTEQRRKIILKALTDSGEVDESREISQAKVQRYIESKNPSDTISETSSNTYNLPPSPKKDKLRKKVSLLTLPSTNKKENSISSVKTSNTQKTQPDFWYSPTNKPFKPQWANFNTMKARWTYIEPQVRHLVEEKEMIAPTKNQRSVMVKERLYHGNLDDVSYCESVKERSSVKSKSIVCKTISIGKRREAEAKKMYIPNPCVKY